MPVSERMDVYVSTLDAEVAMATMDCPSCGTIYSVTEAYRQRRYKDGKSWWCPNGHSVSYGETEADRLRKRLEREERARQQTEAALSDTQDRYNRERRAHAATKGAATRAAKRAEAGVCPHCSRTFVQMARHMRAKHQGAAAAAALAEEMRS